MYELLRSASIGDVLTYEQLGEALDLDPVSERNKIQMAVRRAAQEHEQQDKRALDSVTNVGYRIVEASEHILLARRHQSKASKALVRGHSKAINVDLSGLDSATRGALETVARAFAMQMEFNRRFDVRQKRLEAALDAASTRVDRSEQEIAELRARLDRLEGA
ncbi:hypothetical protein JYK22_21470, partial [Nonomuraea sp. RK-328]|nr:hypothetical protein [Nonomuraea sp. RK-328]